MTQIVKIKNNSGSDGTWAGQFIAADAYYQIESGECEVWKNDNQVFADIANGALIVNNGTEDLIDAVRAWSWLMGDTMPYSRHLEGKLAVHSSAKPEPPGSQTYAVWAGSGDDPNAVEAADSLGAGPILTFNMSFEESGPHIETKDVWFDPRHGRVWIHEAYIKFEDGGVQDYMSADIMAPASPLLTHTVSLDLVVDADGWVTAAPGGAGTGTHGFAGTPSLLPRTYSNDGDWDWDGTNLTPNLTSTGGYRINANEMSVHRYFNKIPLYGTVSNYITMSSEETAELPVSSGYFIRISVHNLSNTNWNMTAIMEIFRERTVDP
jgi:hypothetical protein